MADHQGNTAAIPRVGIIGCGCIGSLWDEPRNSDQTWTHAGAYQQSGLVNLVAVADSDKTRLRECAKNRGIAAYYLDYKEMIVTEKLDILSICTPANLRYDIFRQALKQGIRFFYCEKPIASTATEAIQLQQLIQQYPDAQVMVNYLRRWEPGLTKVKAMLEQNKLGAIQKITASYGKGILNNGTHWIDLLNGYFGQPSQIKVLKIINDDLKNDVTLDIQFIFSYQGYDFPVYLLGSDHRKYSLFELDIIAEKGRIKSCNHLAIDYYAVEENKQFSGYMTLQSPQAIKTDLAHSMLFAVQELVACYQGKVPNIRCQFEDALVAFNIAQVALQKSKLISHESIN